MQVCNSLKILFKKCACVRARKLEKSEVQSRYSQACSSVQRIWNPPLNHNQWASPTHTAQKKQGHFLFTAADQKNVFHTFVRSPRSLFKRHFCRVACRLSCALTANALHFWGPASYKDLVNERRACIFYRNTDCSSEVFKIQLVGLKRKRTFSSKINVHICVSSYGKGMIMRYWPDPVSRTHFFFSVFVFNWFSKWSFPWQQRFYLRRSREGGS